MSPADSTTMPKVAVGAAPGEARAEADLDLARKIGVTMRGIAAFGRRHRTTFFKGLLAAVGVVAARLVLPWPLRSVASAVTGPEFSLGVPAGLDVQILQLSLLFLLCIAALGLLDHLSRLYFSRFAIATTRDMRQAVLGVVLGGEPTGRKVASGDLVSRLIGDTARVKAGMQGFLVHVATNGLLFIGVTVILWVVDPRLGLFFTLAAVATGLLTLWGARRIFRVSLQNRRKEGKLANRIYSSLRKPQPESKLRKINESSSRHEASLTRMQGRVTWAAHLIFGIAVVGSLWSGVQAVASGAVAADDLVLFMFYVLMLAGPITRLARQGTRTGKILSPAYRLVQMLQPRAALDGRVPAPRLKSLKQELSVEGLKFPLAPVNGPGVEETGCLSLKVRRGERVAIVDASGAAGFLLEVIAGERDAGGGSLAWDQMVLPEGGRSALGRQVALFAPDELASGSMPPLAERFRQMTLNARRRVSVWCYLNPDAGLSRGDAREVLSALALGDPANPPTVIVATARDCGLENYDRVLRLRNGRIVPSGS